MSTLNANANAIIAALIWIVSITAQTVDSCYDGICYHRSSGAMDWMTARMYCADVGYDDLAIILTLQQNTYVNENLCSSYRCWLGLFESPTTGVWRWVNGIQLEFSYWNDQHGQPSGGEYFGAMWEANGWWNDCSWATGFSVFALCQKNETSEPTATPMLLPTVVPTTQPTSEPIACPTYNVTANTDNQDADHFISFNLSLHELVIISVFLILVCLCCTFFFVYLRTHRFIISEVPQRLEERAEGEDEVEDKPHTAVIYMSNISKY